MKGIRKNQGRKKVQKTDKTMAKTMKGKTIRGVIIVCEKAIYMIHEMTVEIKILQVPFQ